MTKLLLSMAILAVALFCTGPVAADPPSAQGTISDVSLSGNSLQSFVLTDSSGATLTVSVSAATGYFLSGELGAESDVADGARAEVVFAAPPANGAGAATLVRIISPPASPPITMAGTVLSVGLDISGMLQSFVMELPVASATPSTDLTVAVTPDTTYTLGIAAGAATGASTDVTVGASVAARLASAPVDNAATALSVRIIPTPSSRPIMVSGMVERLETDANEALQSLVLEIPARGHYVGGTMTILATAGTKLSIGEAPCAPTDILAGDRAVVRLSSAPRDDAGTALWVRVIPQRGVFRHGTVESVVTDASGALKSFVLDAPTYRDRPASVLVVSVIPATAYRLGNKPGSAADVAVGTRAKVQFQSPPVTGAGVALFVDALPPAATR